MLIDDILPNILPDLPNCPTLLARNELRNAAIEFCEKTLAWNALHDPIILIDNQREYELDTPDGARVVSVMMAWSVNGRFFPKTMLELSSILPGWLTATSSLPLYYNHVAPANTVRVYPTPYQANSSTVTFRVAYAPTRTATEIDDDFVEANFDALCKGAKARLMLMDGKDWSKPVLGAKHEGDFKAAIVDERIKHLMDGAVGAVYAQPRAFGLS
jgi:hypothetical protein